MYAAIVHAVLLATKAFQYSFACMMLRFLVLTRAYRGTAGDVAGTGKAYGNLGNVHYSLGDYAEAKVPIRSAYCIMLCLPSVSCYISMWISTDTLVFGCGLALMLSEEGCHAR